MLQARSGPVDTKALFVYLFTEHIQLEEVIFCSDKNPGLIFQTWSGMVVQAYNPKTQEDETGGL